MEHQPYTLCADTFNMRLCCSARCPHKKRHRAAINHLVGIRPRLYDKRLLAKKLWFQLQRPLFPARAGRMAYTYHLVGYPLFFLLLRRSKLRSTCRYVRCSLCHLRLFVESKWLRIYFLCIAVGGLYGMGISGTRAAMGVIMGGMLMITVIAKNWKALLAGIFISISVFVFFSYTNIGSGNQYIHKMRSSFHPSEDASYQVRVENRQRMKELMAKKPLGYGIGLSKASNFDSREQMPYPPDSWLVSVWVETGIVGLILYLSIHSILFAWCSWILMFKVRNKGLRGLIAAWLCMDAGFFIATYVNDIMQYPNQLPVYIGFALCFAAPHIDKRISEKKEESEEKERQLSNNEINEQE